MNIANQLVSIFCQLDDFCNELEQHLADRLLSRSASHRRGPTSGLAVSEIMTLLLMFHHVRFRDFKTFYTQFVQVYWRHEFPGLPSYSRFITLLQSALFPLTLFIQLHAGKKTGIYYIDSSCLPVCHLKRSRRHKTFDALAEYGKTSVGWFFGFKLHIVTNEQGQLIAFSVTRGNRSDVQEAPHVLGRLQGIALGDKGYISRSLFDTLFAAGLKLVTRKRKNMKMTPLSSWEKQLLQQRGIIETVIGHLKHHYQVWHTRHRSVFNALTHLVSALAAYALDPLKISAIKLLQRTAM